MNELSKQINRWVISSSPTLPLVHFRSHSYLNLSLYVRTSSPIHLSIAVKLQELSVDVSVWEVGHSALNKSLVICLEQRCSWMERCAKTSDVVVPVIDCSGERMQERIRSKSTLPEHQLALPEFLTEFINIICTCQRHICSTAKTVDCRDIVCSLFFQQR